MSDGITDARSDRYWGNISNVECACGKIHRISDADIFKYGAEEALRRKCEEDRKGRH